MSNEIIEYKNQISAEIAIQEADHLVGIFNPYLEEAKGWVEQAKTINIVDENQVDDILKARELRLNLKKVRTSVENRRKELKEDSLRRGKAIDGFANILKMLIEPVEDHLEKQEKFVELQIKARKEQIESDRKAELEKVGTDSSFYDLKEMPQATFEQLLATAQQTYTLKKEAERKAEDDRIAKEQAEAEERIKVKAEAERLAQEARKMEEEQAKIRAEREQFEREKRDKEEAEAREKARLEAEKKAEEKRLKDEEKKRAKMSDTDKVKSIIDILKAVRFPEMKSDEAKALVADLELDITKMINKVNNF